MFSYFPILVNAVHLSGHSVLATKTNTLVNGIAESMIIFVSYF